jgi:hypothetical protein
MNQHKWQIGPVKLANGCEATIHRFCENRKRYLGELQDGSGRWFAREWDANGWYCFRDKTAEDPFNLAPPPKKTVRVYRALVVYPSGSTCVFTLQSEAIAEAKQHGFALIEIDREVEEGEGL